MKIIISFMLFLSFSLTVFASSRVQDCLDDARSSRLEEINKIVLKINQAETELANFQFELNRVRANSNKLDHDILMRDTAGVVAAIGFATTLLYHKNHVTPGVFILVGGYTLSALSAIVVAIEDKGVRLSRKEIRDLEASVVKLERLIAKEKKNLEKEIDVLNSYNF